MGIHVDAWDKSWQQFRYDTKTQEISMVQIDEKKGSSQYMEWWKWFLVALVTIVTLGIGGIIATIIYALVAANRPDLGGTFKDVATNIVKWPNQKFAKLRKIESPNHVVMFVDVNFSPTFLP